MIDQLKYSPTPWHVEREEWTDGRGIAIIASNGDIALVIDPEHHADEVDIGNAELVVRAVNSHTQLIRSARHLLIEIENTFPFGVPVSLAAWAETLRGAVKKAETPTEWIKKELPKPRCASSASGTYSI